MLHRVSGHRIGLDGIGLERERRRPTRGKARMPARSERYAVQTPAEVPAVFSSIGPLEIVLVIVVLLVIFGPKRLPSLGRSLGTGMREFKESITGEDKQRDETDAAGRPALTQAQADAAAPSPAAETAPQQRG
jgi:sec-independent protein translocase protein TatA